MATQADTITPSRKATATVVVTTATDGLSNIIDTGGLALGSIQMSTAWTAASITFMGAVSSTNAMSSVRHTTASVELTYLTTAVQVQQVDPTLFAGLRYIQIRSGSTTTPVAQTAARTLILGLTPSGQIK